MPGRYLAALLVIVVALLAGVLDKNAFSPASWHRSFKVGLGLDLSSGTQVTLQAISAKNGVAPSQQYMTEARTIIANRVNGAGFSGAQVAQQGSKYIVVSVPGKGSEQVVKLVGTTAQLRFRQVLLEAPNFSSSAAATPPPSPSASPSANAKASPAAPAGPKASASPRAAASSKAASSGTGQAAAASVLAGTSGSARRGRPASAPSPSPGSSAKASKPAKTSPAVPAATTPPAAARPVLSTTKDGSGNAALLNSRTAALFDKLNCNTNWQQQIYHGDPSAWDATGSQTVACYAGAKYALDVAKVTGQEVTTASGQLDSTNGGWVVSLGFNGAGTKAFGVLTANMFTHYYNTATNSPTSVLDSFAIVLDGNIVSAPDIQQAITGGQAQISGGNFTQAQVDTLANQLNYGSLPLTFRNESTTSVSAQLGSSQLSAGLLAAGIGLLLVVVYSFLYYRGLGIVSVSSLVIAALLSYLAVVLLTKHAGFTLNLAGIAGLIVAIGITADSFVVYFERLRDEVREGRSLRAAVERGWQRARRTILVSDTVSFLAAALLYIFAIGDVKGFAFTLGLTTLIDVAVVFLFTKPMITLLARTKFFGQGHRLSGLDPGRLGARSPWRGTRRVPGRPAPGRPATGGATALTSPAPSRTTPKEA